MKIGYLFAGQGAQKTGMGKDCYHAYEASRSIYDQANLALGMDIKGLCFEGDQELLNQTEITQPAILTTSIALLKAFESRIKVTPTAVAGLSLGEYSAHVCSGSMSFEDAVKLVRKRGSYMQRAVPSGVGGMLAITGLNEISVNEVLVEAAAFGYVSACNYNSPKQIVIGGEIKALHAAQAIAKEKGARRAMLLPVSAPFHTQMLKPAEEALSLDLHGMHFSPMSIPVISNVDGRIVPSEHHIAAKLSEQVTSAVKWTACIEAMRSMGIDTMIEFGPGDALSAFVHKIDPSIRVHTVYDVASLEQTVGILQDTFIEKAM